MVECVWCSQRVPIANWTPVDDYAIRYASQTNLSWEVSKSYRILPFCRHSPRRAANKLFLGRFLPTRITAAKQSQVRKKEPKDKETVLLMEGAKVLPNVHESKLLHAEILWANLPAKGIRFADYHETYWSWQLIIQCSCAFSARTIIPLSAKYAGPPRRKECVENHPVLWSTSSRHLRKSGWIATT